MGKMVFSEENGDFWGGFYQGRESQETLLLRTVEGKTARHWGGLRGSNVGNAEAELSAYFFSLF